MQGSATRAGAHELLDVWERGVAASPPERADKLLTLYDHEGPTSLGARNAALLALRARLFGSLQSLRCNCPSCSAIAEFTIDCDALADELLPDADAPGIHSFDAAGFHVDFRIPAPTDVRMAAQHAGNHEAFVRALLERCVTSYQQESGAVCQPESLPPAVAEALSQRMAALEPGAVVSFDVMCPECGTCWSAPMDCGDVLWSEVQARVERLLMDVDVLARAYGWSEADVLALSPMRRAAYLQLVGVG